jgi:hydrophobe/amphiphile efflux-3 (HAE3) family protein
MMKWIGRFVIRFPKMVIALVIAITLFFGYFIPQVKFNNDARDFIPPGDPERQYNEEMQEVFGNDDVLYIGLVTDNVYTPQRLAKVAKLTTLLKDIDGIDDVTSLATVKNIEGTSGGMDVYPFVDEDALPATAEEAQKVQGQLQKWDVLVNNLVSADGKATSIVVKLKPKASIDMQESVFNAARKIITQNTESGESYHYSGYTAINVLLGEYMIKDIRNLLPIAFIVVAASLFLSFRKLKGVVLPLLNVGLSVIWTVGAMSLLHIRLSLVCTSIPVILVSVGTAYAIHIIRDYYDEIKRGLAKDEIFITCFSKIGIAVIMAGLTTVAGFATLYTSAVIPIRDFGVFSAFGTFVALVLGMIFVPAILYLEKLPGEEDNTPEQQTARAQKLTHTQMYRRAQVTFAIKHRVAILIIGLAVIAISAWGTSKLFVDDNGVAYFRQGTQVRNDDAILSQHFGGTHMFSVIVTGPEQDSIKEPIILKNMAGLQQDIQAKFPAVGKTMSIADYIKKMNMAMNEDDPSYYTLPDNRDMVAQYLLTYESGGEPDDFNDVVDYNYQRARIIILSKDGSTLHTQKIIDEIYAYAKANFDPRYQVRVTGSAYTPIVMDRYVVTGQRSSIISSIIMVWLLTCIIFRSLLGGLITIIPLSVTVLINFAVMGFLKIPLEIGTSIVANVAVGIGVDYAIHYLTRFRYEYNALRLSHTYEGFFTAAVETAISSGQAILFNAISVAVGFLVLIFSTFMPLVRLGALVAAVMFISSFGSMILLPAILVTFKPKFATQKVGV